MLIRGTLQAVVSVKGFFCLALICSLALYSIAMAQEAARPTKIAAADESLGPRHLKNLVDLGINQRMTWRKASGPQSAPN